MNIERINDNTIKLYLTNHDIEERGYDSNTVWLNPAKSDELFMEVLQEADEQEYLEAEGLMWAYVRGMDAGVEIVVTRSNAMKEIEKMFTSIFEQDEEELLIEDMLFSEEHYGYKSDAAEDAELQQDAIVYVFDDIDELVPLAHRLMKDELTTSLYTFENKFYLVLATETLSANDLAKYDAIISEYIVASEMTTYYLKEYGVAVMLDHCFETVTTHFV
ncbi:hypothetical protein GCM10007425_12970 [Lysinibacillus alkalisoli]|uniref:Adapter protein MecA n=1 Tax=Lysinibacillus alkalisoli TaxID=1911548 RepID=A0A917G328_9BACI|nr:adaptor protein MecA [Lysinibacillus alkalisoli]GGG19993.1 hypothetical protein GCM10007425_12970 [Lysinibacillus alkalisoli]